MIKSTVSQIFLLFSLYLSSFNRKYLKLTTNSTMDITHCELKLFIFLLPQWQHGMTTWKMKMSRVNSVYCTEEWNYSTVQFLKLKTSIWKKYMQCRKCEGILIAHISYTFILKLFCMQWDGGGAPWHTPLSAQRCKLITCSMLWCGQTNRSVPWMCTWVASGEGRGTPHSQRCRCLEPPDMRRTEWGKGIHKEIFVNGEN